MAWTSTDWDHFVYFVQGHVECPAGFCRFEFDDSDVYALGSVVYGQPSVAFTGNSTWPWMMAYHQGSTYAYVRRKTATGAWSSPIVFYTYGRTTSPAAGSWKNSTRRAVFSAHGSN